MGAAGESGVHGVDHRVSAWAVRQFRPSFFYVYLPHLDYAAQRTGPDSEPARRAVGDLDGVLGQWLDDLFGTFASEELLVLAASEYVIAPVDHVTFPNRVLREAGLLSVLSTDQGELIDLAHSAAWALVDHQFSHVFVRHADAEVTARVVDLFRRREGIAEVLVGPQRGKYHLVHERSGEIILISTPNSWQAYYWWFDAPQAPVFARTVDIHRKPGYDPVELHFDPATKSIPLDASLVRGSHGAPALDASQQGVLLASRRGVLESRSLRDTDVAAIVLRQLEN